MLKKINEHETVRSSSYKKKLDESIKEYVSTPQYQRYKTLENLCEIFKDRLIPEELYCLLEFGFWMLSDSKDGILYAAVREKIEEKYGRKMLDHIFNRFYETTKRGL